ncbi:MAG: hypothetical protein HY059_16515 [Proteobacteria bacterium]|nr:hypothetical protein [Pseudomonadota bacterium]
MRIWGAFISGGVAVLLGLELLLRLLPVSTGFGFLAVNEANPVLRGAPGGAYTYSRGWNMRLARTGRLNADGFVASYGYLPDRASVAVIGNSFVQAAALDPADTLQERLNVGAPTGRQAIAIGQAGAHVADYLAAAAWAHAAYRVEAMVIVLTVGDVLDAEMPKAGGYHFSVDGAGTVAGPLRTDRGMPGFLAATANGSRLLRYLYDNLSLLAHVPAPADLLRVRAPAKPSRTGPMPPRIPDRARFEALADAFLARLPAAAGLPADRIVLVVDADRPALLEKRVPEPRDIDLLGHRARAAGFRVLELDAPFRAAGPPLDFLPLDGHWNARAHAIVADRLSALLPQP